MLASSAGIHSSAIELTENQEALIKALLRSEFGPIFLLIQIILLEQEQSNKEKLARYFANDYTKAIKRIVAQKRVAEQPIDMKTAIMTGSFAESEYLEKLLAGVKVFQGCDNKKEFWSAFHHYFYQTLMNDCMPALMTGAYSDLLTAHQLFLNEPGSNKALSVNFKLSYIILQKASIASNKLKLSSSVLENVRRQFKLVNVHHQQDITLERKKSDKLRLILLVVMIASFISGMIIGALKNNGIISITFPDFIKLLSVFSGPIIALAAFLSLLKCENKASTDYYIEQFKRAYERKPIKLLLMSGHSGYFKQEYYATTQAQLFAPRQASACSLIPEHAAELKVPIASVTRGVGNYRQAKPAHRHRSPRPINPLQDSDIIQFANGMSYDSNAEATAGIVMKFQADELSYCMVKARSPQGAIQYAALDIRLLKKQGATDAVIANAQLAFAKKSWVKVNTWRFRDDVPAHSKLCISNGDRIASLVVAAQDQSNTSLLWFNCYIKAQEAHRKKISLSLPRND